MEYFVTDEAREIIQSKVSEDKSLHQRARDLGISWTTFYNLAFKNRTTIKSKIYDILATDPCLKKHLIPIKDDQRVPKVIVDFLKKHTREYYQKIPCILKKYLGDISLSDVTKISNKKIISYSKLKHGSLDQQKTASLYEVIIRAYTTLKCHHKIDLNKNIKSLYEKQFAKELEIAQYMTQNFSCKMISIDDVRNNGFLSSLKNSKMQVYSAPNPFIDSCIKTDTAYSGKIFYLKNLITRGVLVINNTPAIDLNTSSNDDIIFAFTKIINPNTHYSTQHHKSYLSFYGQGTIDIKYKKVIIYDSYQTHIHVILEKLNIPNGIFRNPIQMNDNETLDDFLCKAEFEFKPYNESNIIFVTTKDQFGRLAVKVEIPWDETEAICKGFR
ncbi:hypothetical protein LNTAR_16418 [Lentisphaera araneosa HTCC2155]|uniref:Uncharacterized protein n=1 Tax=Lentisphaera araneosa HTCC2155 TaxID=313628 RepID=A6DQ98_9BACT|nr:hypothetical protein [Lentisphaera araneosa]EDM26149.1 hypothetical protein LNTAR_16418 [Lentisphaera araneosa HTCC2155]